jgi:hypothetical protein
MLADFFALRIKQVGFGPLECPGQLPVCSRLASVDLDSRRMSLQNNFLAGWGLKVIGNFRPLDVSEVGH